MVEDDVKVKASQGKDQNKVAGIKENITTQIIIVTTIIIIATTKT